MDDDRPVRICARVLDCSGIGSRWQGTGDDLTLSEINTQDGLEGAIQAPLAGGVGHSQYQDHAGHGDPELQNARDGRKGDVGLSIGLQPDPPDHAAILIAG